MYAIGDYVRLDGEQSFRQIRGIEVHTYMGMRGNVSVDYILYLGKGCWKSACAVVEHKRKAAIPKDSD